MSGVLFGVDVSHHNGTVDWPAMKRAGITFGIAKATQGRAFRDRAFTANLQGMRAAGILPGAYHFLNQAPADEQVNHFLQVIAQAGGRPDGMLLAVDVEKTGTSDPDPKWGNVQAFVTEFRRRLPDHPLIVYSGHWYWDGHLGDPDAKDLRCPLWDSRYVNGADHHAALYGRVPGTWWRARYGGFGQVAILQFTSSAVVGGEAHCDANAFRGDLDDLRALAHSTPPATTATPEPQEPDMDKSEPLYTPSWLPKGSDGKPAPKWSVGTVLASTHQLVFEARAAASAAAAQDAAQTAAIGKLAEAVAKLGGGESLPDDFVTQVQNAARAGAEAALEQAVHVDVTVGGTGDDPPEA